MSTTLGVLGLSCIVLGVGCIDGGYNGVPMNDNWIGFFGFTATGIAMMIGCIATQEGD
jgi:hypothetical protein|tara:strand:+ start:832 stop:1005 length:174 start_codon:yes stop_codon:yes gene_type:complete